MLYVCATPIGNLDDVTARVLEALRRGRADRRRRHPPHAQAALRATTSTRPRRASSPITKRPRPPTCSSCWVRGATWPWSPTPGCRASPIRPAPGRVAAAGEPAADRAAGPSAPVTALVASGLAADAGLSLRRLSCRDAPTDLRSAVEGWRRCGGVVVAFETAPDWRAVSPASRLWRRRSGRSLPRAHQAARRGSTRHASELSARFSGDVKGEITLVIDAGVAAAGEAAASERGRRRRLCGSGPDAPRRRRGPRRLSGCQAQRGQAPGRQGDAGRLTRERLRGRAARPGCDRLVAYQRPSRRRSAVDLLTGASHARSSSTAPWAPS